MRRSSDAALVALVVALGAGPRRARAEEPPPAPGAPSDLRAELARQAEALARQQAELDRLRQRVARLDVEDDAAGGAAQVPAQGPALAWNELEAGGLRLRLYGFLRADAIYDESRMNDPRNPIFVRSEDPAAPPGVGARKDRGGFIVHPRATRLGLAAEGPPLEALGGAEPEGRVEVDFFGPGFSESREALRLRLAYVTLAWGDLTLLLGQDWDVISPLRPTINVAQGGDLWGAGNLGDRRPQARLRWTPEVGPGRLSLEVAAGMTGVIDGRDLDPPGSPGAGILDGESARVPGLQARAGYRVPLWTGGELCLGAWAWGAWERPDRATSGRRDYAGWVAGGDLELVVIERRLWVRAEAWGGDLLDDVRGAVLQGIDPTTGRTIRARGGWVELAVAPLEPYTVILGGAVDDPFDGDLPRAGRAANRVVYLAQRVRMGPLELGLDLEHWETRFVGLRAGRNERVMAYAALVF